MVEHKGPVNGNPLCTRMFEEKYLLRSTLPIFTMKETKKISPRIICLVLQRHPNGMMRWILSYRTQIKIFFSVGDKKLQFKLSINLIKSLRTEGEISRVEL